jgi:hypothetical protein
MAILIGSAAAVVIVVAIVVLATGLSGAAPLSIPGFPDLGRPAPAPVVAPSADQAQREPGTTAPPPLTRSGVTETPSPSRTPPGRSQSHTPPPHPTKTK